MVVEDFVQKPDIRPAKEKSPVKEEDSDSERQLPVVEFYKPAPCEINESEDLAIAR